MKSKLQSLLFAFALFVLPTQVIADSNAPARLIPVAMGQKLPMPPAKKLVLPVAQLMRVDEGVFELEIGKTIDLTDRKILLSINYGRRKECCDIRLNGRRVSWDKAGTRFNLKDTRSTESFVQDKEVCFLDLIDLVLPKGAAGIATFRLHCL